MSLLGRLFQSLRDTPPPPAETLYQIFLRSQRGDLHKWHHYFDIYERHLAPLRGRPITLLEIGLWRGGSLRMWREYFGESAKIVGIDVEPAAAQYEREGFRIFIGDQADRDFLRKVKDEIGTIDVVIDDGGHTMSQQVNTFEELYPITTRLFIVEDTHTSYWQKYQDRPDGTFMEYAKGKVDLLHEWHCQPDSFVRHSIPPEKRPASPPVSEFCAATRSIHFYDSVVVFEKGENAPRWHEMR